MIERSHYHFALTLTPPQYKVLLEAIEIYAKNADFDMESIHDDILMCEDETVEQELEDKAHKSEQDAAMLRNIKEAILNQINAEPKV